MELKDLHILQQLYLSFLYTEGALKPTITDDDLIYDDIVNNVKIKLKDLKSGLPCGWGIFIDDEESEIPVEFFMVSYEIDNFKGMDSVLFRISNKYKGESDLFDRYGLLNNSYISGDLELAIEKQLAMLEPFIKIDESVAVAYGIFKRLMVGIEKAKKLPKDFLDSVVVDYPMSILLRRICIDTTYTILNEPFKYRRHTPIIKTVDEHTFDIYYEKPDKASMTIVLGKEGTGVDMKLLSSTGKIEGGVFTLKSEKDLLATLNSTVGMLEQIVEDTEFRDEYKPLLKRFLQYFNKGIKQIKYSYKLDKE